MKKIIESPAHVHVSITIIIIAILAEVMASAYWTHMYITYVSGRSLSMTLTD